MPTTIWLSTILTERTATLSPSSVVAAISGCPSTLERRYKINERPGATGVHGKDGRCIDRTAVIDAAEAANLSQANNGFCGRSPGPLAGETRRLLVVRSHQAPRIQLDKRRSLADPTSGLAHPLRMLLAQEVERPPQATYFN